MGMTRTSLPILALTAALGVGLGAWASGRAGGDPGQCRQTDSSALQARIAELEAELARMPAAFASPARSVATVNVREPNRPVARGAPDDAAARTDAAHRDPDQLLKDLLTLPWNDRRSVREKLHDFLAENPGRDGIAIASKGLFELVDNAEVLPDPALESLYLEQQDPDFKRVLAQVASMRGDNSLIELHIAETGAGLGDASPAARQQALVALSRTRHVAAAELAVPLLRDRDPAVVLDALLALRATGNQRHVRAVEPLLHHPDESVSWLAMDVITDLQSLSEVARTRIAGHELAAELPPLPLPSANSAARCDHAAR